MMRDDKRLSAKHEGRAALTADWLSNPDPA